MMLCWNLLGGFLPEMNHQQKTIWKWLK